ncbi:glutamate synthase-related protein [Roseibium aggregatum]|uniref:Glutamate synthase large subunit n=1 Tax=Roseibium aggregatum TaxID=187304 RepID=A0A939J144_9HYPH|nr:glutamate synthase-related protein [Roseibium aggregatum]MBN9671741.1 glutamate synthase large subunit [Roseibium aggregatum]
MEETGFGLYDAQTEKSSCGVGFITRKDGHQTHDVLRMAHEALCAVPHRGGMSSEGVGDGAGVSIDLSESYFRHLTGREDLALGTFGVGNFFLPNDTDQHGAAEKLVADVLTLHGFSVILKRDLPVDNSALRPRAVRHQLPIRQWVFTASHESGVSQLCDKTVHKALLAIEAEAYTRSELAGLYPLSLSTRTQVFKGRLNSYELVPYFTDLRDPEHKVHTLYFHTRFSTNTDPHPSMAQPFRFMAHNGELNTDKKNRLSETAVARAKNANIIRPRGQSDSCRLDQTLQGRVLEDDLDLVTAVVSMMPPAWENDTSLSAEVRAMLEYFSLYEEKNDGPAALIFGDGTIIGARLDRLGLRPLRTTETAEYLAVMSEAGQIGFPPEDIVRRGRIEAGGMLYYDHGEKRVWGTRETLERLAAKQDYEKLLSAARLCLAEHRGPPIRIPGRLVPYEGDLELHQRYVAYSHNQESFKFLMDPMLATGAEKISAMGYGAAINALSDQEGGVAKYFSQRFAQVTNPPLDSIREADGMTLRVALGAKPSFSGSEDCQIVIDSPILSRTDMKWLRTQTTTPVKVVDILYTPVPEDREENARALEAEIAAICSQVAEHVGRHGGIVILSDRQVSSDRAALPLTLIVSAVNQRLIEEGLRLKASLIGESGQISSAHHIAAALGFGASAVYPLAVQLRAEETFPQDADAAFKRFAKAAEKSLLKTMGKVGLCTAESYIGGEFFEPNFLDTSDPVLKRYFPNVRTPVGGVGFTTIATAVNDWHQRARTVSGEKDIPLLGLFKERAEGAGHSYGTTAVRGFVDMTEEKIQVNDSPDAGAQDEYLRLLPVDCLEQAFGLDEKAYTYTNFDRLTPAMIDAFTITPGYRAFSRMMSEERGRRPAALRDVLDFPADVSFSSSAQDFERELGRFAPFGNSFFYFRGLSCHRVDEETFKLALTGPGGNQLARRSELAEALVRRFPGDVQGHWLEDSFVKVRVTGPAADFLSRVRSAPEAVSLGSVQPASEITPLLASGAMSHGALVASAHEAVAHGTNMAGGMSNSGEGGEHISRYGTIRSSKIKQFASGRFGVWAGYLADPSLEEIEIKIGQGAKPGEGGQLPAPKVTVEIAAARGGTPGVELVSPPPHHDTYSIEDLAQLIHDAKAARVRVIVKLVSSEGIGTIAVGVAKAGADVINVAGNTGGTGAAAVTSLKYTGRSAEIGIAEVHQALCANGIRQKVVLRCSGAHQTASDVVKSALLGADSFEFGTTALMMLKCVMAKNCNVKCPAGLTTNPEVFDGDPRALAQYLLNIAHETREILSGLGLPSLREARGRADLLHLIDHAAQVGRLDLRAMLACASEVLVDEPVYLEKDFQHDDRFLEAVRRELFEEEAKEVVLKPNARLNNCNKTVAGQLAVDIERLLNYQIDDRTARAAAPVFADHRGRRYFDADTIRIETAGSAGQSFGAFCNDGMRLEHSGTCNDGVGKSACGGTIVVRSPGGGSDEAGGNVLIGNFALFGATGGRTFIEGQAGDRFAVRNSGATAVVEGVGEFCCEYMTNGAVLNIGSFGKGFANGMSGGFAYQYDPYGELAGKASHDSVELHGLHEDTPLAAMHADAVHFLLELHAEATGSAKAAWLLDHWESESRNFVYAMPKSLLLYQDSDAILAARPRKELIEELSAALVAHQLEKFKTALKAGKPILDGAVPGYGQTDTEEMYALLNNYLVMSTAQSVALTRVSGSTAITDTEVEKAARNLLLTEDFSLLKKLQAYARTAVSEYGDEELAVLIADKRLRDYKTALARRNVLSMDSPGTYGWILHQNAKNREKVGKLPSFEELFARHSIADLMAFTATHSS